jgi:hypothetical protein
MNRRNKAGWFAVIATLGLFGCGPGEPERGIPEDAERCVVEEDSGGALEARAVALGVGGAGSFRSFQDGEEVELVRRFSGGIYDYPAVRVEAAGGFARRGVFSGAPRECPDGGRRGRAWDDQPGCLHAER